MNFYPEIPVASNLVLLFYAGTFYAVVAPRLPERFPAYSSLSHKLYVYVRDTRPPYRFPPHYEVVHVGECIRFECIYALYNDGIEEWIKYT